MYHNLGAKLSLLVAALFLVVGAAPVQEASAANPAKACLKDQCKTPKKDCLKGFTAESKTAKAECTAAKTEGISKCKSAKTDGIAGCAGDKDCKKDVISEFKDCKARVMSEFNTCKSDVKETLTESKTACNEGFKLCNSCCHTGLDLAACVISICGDGILVEPEPCDDKGESATCDADCTPVACGDGTKNSNAGEECDDGNLIDGDGRRDFCDSNCTETGCGNGIKTAGESCDPGDNPMQPSADCGEDLVCSAGCECVPELECGNGITQPDNGEECDPPGEVGACGAGYICDENCQCVELECGNGTVDAGEECDPPGSSAGCNVGANELCNSDCVCEACPCCTFGYTRLESTVVVAEGTCGSLRSFRCSNAADIACTPGDNSACDVGPCYVTPPFCAGNFAVSCSKNSDCQGACQETIQGSLPLDLECGGLYTGGGLNSVPLPFAIPDRNKVLLKIESCDPQLIELGAVTLNEADKLTCSEGRKCSNGGAPCVLDSDCGGGECEDRCLFGAPLPVPNPGTPATSVCAVNVVGEDATGTGTCLGDADISAPLRSVIYLNGDLFKASTPPSIPGVQPCPLCVPICQGGSKDGWPCRPPNPNRACAGGSNAGEPCTDNSNCPGSTCTPARNELADCTNGGGTCPSTSECLGGPNNGQACTPATSTSDVLGEAQDAFPTSHDCGNDPLQNITENIGGLPIDFAMTTGSLTAGMPRQAVDRASGRRNFCGFCRDVTGGGSLCFEGDTGGGCPTAIPPADGNAVPCNSDTECADGDEYESCVQRSPGAFSEAGATTISMEGEPPGCLADGTARRGTTVGTFCIPPTFDATVDAAGDLPGPGGVSLQADTLLR